MRNGLPAGPLPTDLALPFRDDVERACEAASASGLTGFSPFVAEAVHINESGASTDPAIMQIGTVPGTDFLEDGSNAGHGRFMLTSSWPSNWADPYANALYALEHDGLLMAAEAYWAKKGFQGDDLARLIFASFNAGIGGAEDGHNEGDCDKYTTNRYAERALAHYIALRAGNNPLW